MESNNRRKFLIGAGTLAVGVAGIGTTTNVFAAESDVPLLLYPNPEDEYLIVKNTTDSPFSLDGYYVDFEYIGQEDQRYPIPSRHTIPAGDTIKIATGAMDVPEGAIDMGEPGNEMNDSESDVYAILDSDKNVVARSDQGKYRASTDPSEEPTTDETTSKGTSSTEEETTTTEDDSDETTSNETTTTDESDSSESDSGSSDDSGSSKDISDDSQSDDDSDDTDDTSSDDTASSGSDESSGEGTEDDC